MQIKSLKNLNITLLLDSNVDHNAVANKQVFSVVSDTTDELEHVVIEGPDIKVFQFPKLDYNLVIESKRLLVNDKSGKDLNTSEVSSKIIKLHKIMGGKVKAYGYNFDYLVSAEESSVESILGNKLSTLKNVRDFGASLRFDDEGVDVGLDINPIVGKNNDFLVHVNVNHNESFPADESQVKDKLKEAEEIAKKILSKI